MSQFRVWLLIYVYTCINIYVYREASNKGTYGRAVFFFCVCVCVCVCLS